MKNKNIIAIVAIIIALLFPIYFITESNKSENLVCFSKKCIQVEIADTHEKRQRGLMFRNELAEDKGMLFIFETTKVYSFWMKNTYIPLDIIWIDENLQIVHIENATPCLTENCISYSPNAPAKYVVEANSGFSEKNNIRAGDTVKINLK
ncbi:DUF192 domain-containing protein [Patescibacteria group bacterium]